MKEWFADRTVALVGNAASLFDKEYGSEIDEHDVVVRMNKAAMLWTQFHVEKSHGKRTDVWMIFNIGEYRHRSDDMDPSIKKMHMSSHRQTAEHLRIVDAVFPISEHKLLQAQVGYDNPTTGLMAIKWITMAKPKVLDIYGFDWKETPTFTDMEGKREPKCYHQYDLERDLCHNHFLKISNVNWKN